MRAGELLQQNPVKCQSCGTPLTGKQRQLVQELSTTGAPTAAEPTALHLS